MPVTMQYEITKERWTRSSYGPDKGHWHCDKREVIITERKARVMQCLNAAKRNNAAYVKGIEKYGPRWADSAGGYRYKVLVREGPKVEWTEVASETFEI